MRKKQVTEMKPKSFAQLYGEAKKQDAYWVADAIYTFTEELNSLAEIGKVSRAELARRMDVSPAYITQIIRGDVNFTVDTMVRLARRVGARLQLHLVPEEIEAYKFNWNSASIDWQQVYARRVHMEIVSSGLAKCEKSVTRAEAADNYGYANAFKKEKMEAEDELLAACC
jgi:transcriptional regulator with XRE-family HTH domain